MNLRLKKQKNNTVGFTGIYFRKNRNVYVAQIRFDGHELRKRVTRHFKTAEAANEWREDYIENVLGLKIELKSKCYVCKKRKEYKHFYKDKSRARGVCSICKVCSDKRG